MLNISQVIFVRTDSNLCRKELTVHWSAPNSIIRSYLQPCTNSIWGDESEAVAPIIWLYQSVDARKGEVFFPDLLITLRRHVSLTYLCIEFNLLFQVVLHVSFKVHDSILIKVVHFGERGIGYHIDTSLRCCRLGLCKFAIVFFHLLGGCLQAKSPASS